MLPITFEITGRCELPLSTVPSTVEKQEYGIGSEALVIGWDAFVTDPSDCAIKYEVNASYHIGKTLTIDNVGRTISLQTTLDDRASLGQTTITIASLSPNGRLIGKNLSF